ncbi:MAG: AraC family transcriptional regulator [Ruminococcus sp.]|nr:AraC family transcriptional regulator [Ruminococcus sp.]
MHKAINDIENILKTSGDTEHITVYHGMEIYLYSLKAEKISVSHAGAGQIMEINYCHKGRLIRDIGGDNRIYSGSGDFTVRMLDSCTDSVINFPEGFCEGLSLYIDFDKLGINPPEILYSTGICRELFSDKFRNKYLFASFSGNTHTDNIFSGFYDKPDNLKLSYYKIKSIELILYLSTMKTDEKRYLPEYRTEQIEIIRKVHDYLTENIGKHITIEELARQYHINPTTLKAVFKSVYGNSLASHIKEHRMELASRLLRETDLSIAHISEQVGYESQSKFTVAFKTYYNILPRDYRKKNL